MLTPPLTSLRSAPDEKARPEPVTIDRTHRVVGGDVTQCGEQIRAELPVPGVQHLGSIQFDGG